MDKLLKEGRGTGIGQQYKPWIKIQDVPSLGRVTRLKGIKTGRQHEFLSDLERNYFYYLEFSDKVEDIREQFPLLPIEDTLLIAEELGIEHPKHPKTGEYIVMTSDFFITMKQNGEIYEIARTIKPKDELLNRRIAEKFQIECKYWEKRGIDWAIVTENEISKEIAENISFIHGYKDINVIDSFAQISHEEQTDLIYEFVKRVIDSDKSIRALCSEFDNDMCLEKGSALSLFKYLLINKIIEIDMTKKLKVNEAIKDIKLREKPLKKVDAV